VEYP